MDDEEQNLIIDTNNIINNLPSLNTSVNYWLFRANGGQYYDDFNSGDYIGIGWDKISLDYLSSVKDKGLQSKNLLKAKISENYPDDKRPGSSASQILKFAYLLKEGDLVLVPSENSIRYLIGRVTGKVYMEKDEELLDAKRHCPYKKRRKVKWIGVINRSEADPALYKLVYAGHTMSSANDYKGFINRALFDSYISNNTMHSTFMITSADDIDMYKFSKFQFYFSSMYHVLYPKEKIISKTNVQCPGPLEIIGIVTFVANVTSLLFFWLSPNIREIKIKNWITIKKDNPKLTDWHIEKEKRKLRMEEIKAADKHDKELLNNINETRKLAQKCKKPMEDLGIDFSDELKKAIKKSASTKDTHSKN